MTVAATMAVAQAWIFDSFVCADDIQTFLIELQIHLPRKLARTPCIQIMLGEYDAQLFDRNAVFVLM